MLTHLAHWASIVLLAHAAFSCVHFKSLVDDPKLVPPIDVVIEVLVAVLLAPLLARDELAACLRIAAT